jgi:hypothetical protein
MLDLDLVVSSLVFAAGYRTRGLAAAGLRGSRKEERRSARRIQVENLPWSEQPGNTGIAQTMRTIGEPGRSVSSACLHVQCTWYSYLVPVFSMLPSALITHSRILDHD